ncbi:MAG: LptF/LptG family permease [Sulfurovum sp.]|jgi:lipopolysaccharide export system permease protein|nr:MAG: Uncharacterised protein [Arcobacter lacus]
MSILTKYVFKKYIINFLIVLLSLQLFFIGIDLIQNFKDLPSSANLVILYILYFSFFTFSLALPLSLVFGWIVTLVMFIKSNEFVAFNALGATRTQFIKPAIISSLVLIITLIGLQFTPLAYSEEQKNKILKGEFFSSTKNDVFLKYNDNFVYFKKLLPLQKKAEEVYIFKIQNNDVVKTTFAKNAYFQNDKWYVVDAKIIDKPEEIDITSSKIEITNEKFLYTLEGFKPKILNKVYEEKSDLSLSDSISALILFGNQGINTDKIRASVYNQVLVPFFIIPLMLLFFVYSALNNRLFNGGKFISLSIFSTLIVWGVFFLLFRFTTGGVIVPEVSLLAPFILWIVVSMFIYQRKSSF